MFEVIIVWTDISTIPLKEDDEEEREFWSITSYEQQRYTLKIQDIENKFKEILTSMRTKVEYGYFFDMQALDENKELVDDQVSHLRYQVSSWRKRNSDKKSLSSRLEKEIDMNYKKYMDLYHSTSSDIDKKNTAKANKIKVVKTYQDKDKNGKEDKIESKTNHDSEHTVMELKRRIEELEDQIRTMYNANRIVGENLQTLEQENLNLKKQNKNIVVNNLLSVQDKEKVTSVVKEL